MFYLKFFHYRYSPITRRLLFWQLCVGSQKLKIVYSSSGAGLCNSTFGFCLLQESPKRSRFQRSASLKESKKLTKGEKKLRRSNSLRFSMERAGSISHQLDLNSSSNTQAEKSMLINQGPENIIL